MMNFPVMTRLGFFTGIDGEMEVRPLMMNSVTTALHLKRTL
jgi:hypothetical protein